MAMLKTSLAKVGQRITSLRQDQRQSSSTVLRVRAQETYDHLQKIAELDPDYAYHHVIGLHGDQQKGEKFKGNDNGDFFWWRQELLALRKDGMYAYETWRGGDVLENHDENSVRGHIADVWPVFSDKSIDMLMATKRTAFKQLCANIDSGKITDVSMGTIVGHSYCSVPSCHRHASKKNPNITEDDWCEHLKTRKGAFDTTEGVWIYEDNRDIFGVECSWITFGQGADSDAKLRMRVASLTHQQMENQNIALRDRSVLQLYSDRRRQPRS